ncbi:MAG: MipA/OmpV family protein [Magnetovibrionaceae bacterium]
MVPAFTQRFHRAALGGFLAIAFSLSLSPKAEAGPTFEDWDFTVGAGAMVVPEYRGGGTDDVTVRPLPLIRIDYKDVAFLDVQEGLGWNALNLKNYKAGPLVRYYFGSDDMPAGIDEVDPGVQVGGFFNFMFERWKFDVTALQAVSGSSEGFRGDFGVTYGTKINQDWVFTARLGTTFMNGNELATYYGIKDKEEVQSGLSKYTPDYGFENVGLTFTLRYQIEPWLSATFIGGYDYLLPEAADSPIVKTVGSEHQYKAGTGIAFHF